MIPVSGAYPLTHSLRGLEARLESLSKKELLDYIRELIRDKCPSVLYVICHISPDQLNFLIELEELPEAFGLCCEEREVRQFLEKLNAWTLDCFMETPFKGGSVHDRLYVPNIKAYRSGTLKFSATTDRRHLDSLKKLPPIALLIALKSGVSLYDILIFLSPEQLRFLARYADGKTVSQAIELFIKADLPVKLYTLLKALPIDKSDAFSPDSFTLTQFAYEFNAELVELRQRLTQGLEAVKTVYDRAIKGIPSTTLVHHDEEAWCEQFHRDAAKVLSLRFSASVAAFARSQHLLCPDLLLIHNIVSKHVLDMQSGSGSQVTDIIIKV